MMMVNNWKEKIAFLLGIYVRTYKWCNGGITTLSIIVCDFVLPSERISVTRPHCICVPVE